MGKTCSMLMEFWCDSQKESVPKEHPELRVRVIWKRAVRRMGNRGGLL
jgi:hypothetical protein